MNIVQFWVVDTIVKHKTIIPIRLDDDEELAEDMLISDGEYNGSDLDDDDVSHSYKPSAVASNSLFNDISDEEDALPIRHPIIQHSSATKANLHRSDSTQSSVSDDSLYELRTSSSTHLNNKQ